MLSPQPVPQHTVLTCDGRVLLWCDQGCPRMQCVGELFFCARKCMWNVKACVVRVRHLRGFVSLSLPSHSPPASLHCHFNGWDFEEMGAGKKGGPGQSWGCHTDPCCVGQATLERKCQHLLTVHRLSSEPRALHCAGHLVLFNVLFSQGSACSLFSGLLPCLILRLMPDTILITVLVPPDNHTGSVTYLC